MGPIAVEETYGGNYVVCFDPLDGSSNIDAGISVGSIFGVFEPSEQCLVEDRHVVTDSVEGDLTDKRRRPSCTAASRAGTCSPPATSCTRARPCSCSPWATAWWASRWTTPRGLRHDARRHQDPRDGQDLLLQRGQRGQLERGAEELHVPRQGPEGEGSSPYSARYIGSLVGDFHRTMLYGGIYGYPGDKKNVNGKLRLIYECAPMSFLAEQAGGAGSTGVGRVLALQPEAVHQRCPLFIGSTKEREA